MSEITALQLVRRGREAATAGDLRAALADFEQAVRRAPHLVDGWYLLGVTLGRLGHHRESLPALTQALQLAPGRIEIIGVLAYAHFRSGEFVAAEPLFRQLCRARPTDVDCELKLGECLSQLGDPSAAADVFRGALARMPDEPGLWLALAQACDEAGDRAAAEAAYGHALGLRQDWPLALAGLLSLQRKGADDALVARAQTLFDDDGIDPTGRTILGHELGKVYDARGDHARAMDCWLRANALRRAQVGPLDRAAHTVRIEQKLALTMPAGSGVSDDPRPVFVVGLPRSGTTLVEQLLGAHPAAAACGEMRELAQIARALPPAARADDARVRHAAEHYLEAASRRGGMDAERLIDKQPLNSLNLDLVARLFNHAHVIWCRRDVRDVGLSIFSEHMSPETRFAADLADIGWYHGMHERLMRHWQRALPIPILEVDYETLVADFEVGARRIVAFTGLPWDPACLDFHRGAGAVQTPSRWQVRRPVTQGSVGRWRNYAPWLAPLLGAAGDQIDDEQQDDRADE